MASFTLASVNDLWPDGTSVGAYALDALGNRAAAATATATVTGGSLAFTGLADATRYQAFAAGVGRNFRTANPAAGGGNASIPEIVTPPGGNFGTAYTLDLTGKTNVWVAGTLNQAACTITITGRAAGTQFKIFATQDGAGNRALSITDGVQTVTPALIGTPGARAEIDGSCLSTTDAVVALLGSGAHLIQDEGTSQPARSKMDFVGAGVAVTDDSANDKTVVTIAGGGGGSSLGGIWPGHSGRAYLPGTGTGAASNVSAAVGTAMGIPFIAGQSKSLNKLYLNVATAGSAGTHMRSEIRTDSGGWPSNTIVANSDTGIVAALLGDTSGTKTFTYTAGSRPALVAGTLYWLIIWQAETAATNVTLKGWSNGTGSSLSPVDPTNLGAVSGLKWTDSTKWNTGATPTTGTSGDWSLANPLYAGALEAL